MKKPEETKVSYKIDNEITISLEGGTRLVLPISYTHKNAKVALEILNKIIEEQEKEKKEVDSEK